MNNLVFVTEARFIKDSKGNIYGDTSFSISLWSRYLEAFDFVFVIARVKTDVDFEGNPIYLSNSENVLFVEVPHYIGPLEYLKKRSEINKVITRNVHQLSNCKFICRIPGQISNLVINALKNLNKKYAVEVVGDPDDVFAPGAIKHPLRRYFRNKMVKSIKDNIQNASAVLYVTRKTLQNKYPVKTGTYSTYASNVKLEISKTVVSPKEWHSKSVLDIVSIGSLEQMYKAPDVVLEAIRIINKKDRKIKANLLWMGDGKFKNAMIALAKKKGIENNVLFIGNVNKEQVIEYLSNADLFVLASKTEGFPRAIIEAMSVGIPVVGTRVGGIPELIEDIVLIYKNDAIFLAKKIIELAINKDFYNQQAARNLEESKKYQEKFLTPRRLEFYNYIKNNL
jgi:glycosyltransferase involved in cell wall biosynthesis